MRLHCPPSKPRSTKWSVSIIFSDKAVACMCHLNHRFYTLYWGTASREVWFTSEEIALFIQRVARWVGHWFGLYAVAKREVCRDSNPDFLVLRPVARSLFWVSCAGSNRNLWVARFFEVLHCVIFYSLSSLPPVLKRRDVTHTHNVTPQAVKLRFLGSSRWHIGASILLVSLNRVVERSRFRWFNSAFVNGFTPK